MIKLSVDMGAGGDQERGEYLHWRDSDSCYPL
jgi:hypothetical protein